jgi:hypothetical protein
MRSGQHPAVLLQFKDFWRSTMWILDRENETLQTIIRGGPAIATPRNWSITSKDRTVFAFDQRHRPSVIVTLSMKISPTETIATSSVQQKEFLPSKRRELHGKLRNNLRIQKPIRLRIPNSDQEARLISLLFKSLNQSRNNTLPYRLVKRFKKFRNPFNSFLQAPLRV